ncbi:hypothetical protein LDENG_00208370, partial [Lucifuga dentata]
FLICHLLKKKGYRCRTGDVDNEEEDEEKEAANAEDEDEENQDTVEQILKCIIENEANMEAFKEMLGNQSVCVRHDPRLRKESIGGIPPHLHTVHSGSDNSCLLCAQSRSQKNRRQSRTPRTKQRPGEQTVFSVGRFRVTHTDKKLHGGPNPLVGSGDHLDQSHDNEERKEGGYNLRNLFKDSPSESLSGAAPNVDKRKKSLTIFGLRRGSDPSGIKGREGTGKEKCAGEQQPVVLEESPQAAGLAKNMASKTETRLEPTQAAEPALPHEAKPLGPACSSPSSQTDRKDKDSNSVADDGSIKPSTVNSPAAAPSSLPISSPALSGQTVKMMKKRGDEKNEAGNSEEGFDPGPLQTSTPIVLGSVSTSQPEPFNVAGLPITQTHSGLSSSPDLDLAFGGSLALISVGSSPASSFPIKTPSSASSLKTSTSSLADGQSPKLSLRNTLSEGAKTAFSSSSSPNQKLSSVQVTPNKSTIPPSPSRKSPSPLQAHTVSPVLSTSSQHDVIQVSPQTSSSSSAVHNVSLGNSPHLNIKSGSVMTLATEDMNSSPISAVERDQGVRTPNIGEKTEKEMVGILKFQTERNLPVEGDFEDAVFSSPSGQLPKDRLSHFPESPSSPLSPSSALGNRMSSVTIIKASPDSKREFSVVTMMEEEEEEEEPHVSKKQEGETSGAEAELAKVGIGPADIQEGDVPFPLVEQSHMTSKAGTETPASQEKDDMVEMEDIKDCKVKQVEERERLEEEEEEEEDGLQMVQAELNQD